MNVEQLIIRLQNNYEPTDLVMMAKDEEGNSFAQVEDFSTEYVENDYEGGETEEVFSIDDYSDEDDFSVTDFEKNFKRVVVLWP